MSPVATFDDPAAAETKTMTEPVCKVELSQTDGARRLVNGPMVPLAAIPIHRSYVSMLSALSKARKLNSIRALMAAESTPGLTSMLSGKPNPLAFPIVSFRLNIPDQADPSKQVELKIDGKNLAEALQYGPTSGVPRLGEWFARLQAHEHGRVRREGWRITIGAGSQDLVYKAFLALLDPEDTCFVDSLAYQEVLPLLVPIKCSIIAVPVDAQGLDPVFIADVLDHWPEEKPFPKALYTVPSGSNPSGQTTPNERRAQVLELARKYGFLILEDDPDFYLHYGCSPRSSSYFELEKTDGRGMGRVLRFDTLARIVAPGLHVAWCSGPTTIVNAIDLHTSAANLHPSSTSQAISYAYLSHIGIPGFDKHVATVSSMYAARAAAFEKLLHRYMEGLATWTSPDAGIYFGFDLRPAAPQPGDEVPTSSVLEKAFENDVYVLPRAAFCAAGSKSSFVCVALGLLTENEADKGLEQLALVVRGTQEEK